MFEIYFAEAMALLAIVVAIVVLVEYLPH